MIPIPASILAIENESDRDFMENIFFSYQRLIYHEIGSILNDPWNANNAAVMTIALPVFTLTGRFYMPSSSVYHCSITSVTPTNI